MIVGEAAVPRITHVDSPTRIGPAELASLLERFACVHELSLDCFDTVVWRHVENPRDVFYVAAQRPSFQSYGFTARIRVSAEHTARKLQQLRQGNGEVGLAQIYRAEDAELSDEQVGALAEDELAAEMESCFAWPPAVELLRCAHRRNIPVTIVSDTYFDESQLRRLLKHVLPGDAAAAIRKIVCSSEHGISKAQGLLDRVYHGNSDVRSGVLHVGDNKVADYDAALRAGLQAVHLEQHRDDTIARQRMRAVALGVLTPEIRDTRPMRALYRAVEAMRPGTTDASADEFGAAAFGPILHAFARWIAAERRALCERHGSVKLLFLLRDGHLPYLVHQALDPAPQCYPVSISRFTAFAASFRDLSDIDRYLARFADTGRLDVLARQLLLPKGRARQIVEQAQRAADPAQAFCEAVRRPEVAASIVEASSRFRSRFWRYLQRQAGLQRGDTAVFVDLGYSGTAQRLLGPVFEQEWGVDLFGRYLLFSGVHAEKRKGFIDNRCCDQRVIDTLVPYVALIENLCASAIGSVEGYDSNGQAILAPQLVDHVQSRHVEQVQQSCLRFARDAEAFLAQCGQRVPSDWLREGALAEFARLIYFPERSELRQLSDFRLDVNLGSKDVLQLFDCDTGLDDLRKRGINFIQHNAVMRLQYPAELRSAGIELSMTLLARQRFDLDIPVSGWNYRSDDIELLLLRGNDAVRSSVQASATHDGYFAAVLPLGSGDFNVGLLLGLRYRWVQIHCIEIVPMAQLMSHTESLSCRDIRSLIILDGIHDHGSGLWECTGDTSLMMIPAEATGSETPLACRVVFRPIVWREDRSACLVVSEPPIVQ